MTELRIYREAAPDKNVYLRLVESVDGRIFVQACDARGVAIGASFLEITTFGVIRYPIPYPIPIERGADNRVLDVPPSEGAA